MRHVKKNTDGEVSFSVDHPAYRRKPKLTHVFLRVNEVQFAAPAKSSVCQYGGARNG